MTSLRTALILSTLFCWQVVPAALAQSNDDYAEASALARNLDKTHLIYFYNSTIYHPNQFNYLLGDVEIPEEFIVTNLDVNDGVGRALAEAFYARSQLEGDDQFNAVLIIEKNTFSRGITVLGSDPDQIGSVVWDEFFFNALE